MKKIIEYIDKIIAIIKAYIRVKDKTIDIIEEEVIDFKRARWHK